MKLNIVDIAVVLMMLCVFTSLGNAASAAVHVSGDAFMPVLLDSLVAMVLLCGISFAAYLVGKVPGLNKLPVIFWASIIAALLSSPLFPYHKEFFAITEKVSLTVISTVILAYAGLALGKDIKQFKAISWRIIPVSLAVFTGTFIFAALIAQITLRWSNVI